MPQRRPPSTGPNPPPELAGAANASSEPRQADSLSEGSAAGEKEGRVEPARRTPRQLPDFRTRDNIEL